MKRLSYLLICFSLLFVTCTKEELIDEPTGKSESYKQGAKASKHFFGSVNLAIAGPGTLNCGNAIQGPLFSGNGNMRYMGNVNSTASSCITPTPNPLVLDVTTVATLVAANNDEIFLVLNPYQLHVNPNNGFLAGSTKAIVNGGTGRFKYATGSLDISYLQDAEGNVSSSWDGDVAY